MLRQPTSINAGSIRRCREYKNTATFGDVGDEGYYEDVANFDAHSSELENARAQEFFNNSVSAFLAMLSSIIFWCIYWMAKALIVAAGIFVIFSFICPHKCIGLFNYLMDQHQVEQIFRDEL
ncbi:uncharacterized protein LOC118735919 [Rhagoletis pomonella]|uniref:uncharacterized protein LOC118735919 n=1 Tax=Rhagoletis pomonella TaxID=28610 RepID=UPI00177FE727|nr:uncharacterized protein LOC118735919 [Rhagoletis pomonella]